MLAALGSIDLILPSGGTPALTAPAGVVTKDCTPLTSALRMVKEEEEIALIERASEVAVMGMKAAVEAVKAGATESHVALVAESAIREAGAEGFWRTYVCSGPRTNIELPERALDTHRS